IVFKQRITKIQYVALVLSYVGVAVIFSGKISTVGNSNPILGAFFVFFAALTYAMYLVGIGQMLPRIGTRRFTSYSMIAAAIAVLTTNTIINGFDLLKYPLEVYGLVLFMAIFATVVPTFMIAEGIRIIGANNASIIGAIGPVSTILLAYIFLGERLYPVQFLGTLFVIAGVLLITLNKNRQKVAAKKVVKV
ncbi:MAG: DMT family transporter, partial [Bacteroidota bacterium]